MQKTNPVSTEFFVSGEMVNIRQNKKSKCRSLSRKRHSIFCSLTFEVSNLQKPTMKVLLRILAFLPGSNYEIPAQTEK